MKNPLAAWYAPPATSSGSSGITPAANSTPPSFPIPKHLPTAPLSTVKTTPGDGDADVCTNDPTVDIDAEELWRFLTSNLQPPHLEVVLNGIHTETRTRTVTTINAKDATTSRTEDYTVAVEDFNVSMNLSKLVLPQLSRIFTQSEDRPESRPTVRATLEEYTSSKNMFKELHLEPSVVWDYSRVRLLLTDLVRSMGYKAHVEVQFPRRGWKVSAFASNRYSRSAHSVLVQVLCALTCLWIVFWPAWAIARNRMTKKLACEYEMAVGADEFYRSNWHTFHSLLLRECPSLETYSRLPPDPPSPPRSGGCHHRHRC